ncbi:hypothetical protein C4588_04175 [Candidatus Parcubacteria bacterium]|nr:MAG: hypothetical protein C4588_04175 [Candidatus Parcubacteria bacterium]
MGRIITAVSRAIDRHCSRMAISNDYFKLETVTDEQGKGIVSSDGNIFYWARKPKVQSVMAFAYRLAPYTSWIVSNTEYVEINGHMIKFWSSVLSRGEIQIQMSYIGGLASTVDELPADIVEAAIVLVVRFYKEIKSGLGDTIGIAELGTLQYTKALPVRVVEMLKPYVRSI